MIKVVIDTTDIDKLTAAMKRYGGIMPVTKANQALRKSAKPMLTKAQFEVPVWRGGRERINLKKGRDAISRNSNPNYYRQGGATKRDLRIKAVPPRNREIGRVIVGVSKRSGRVGYRTHWIEQGTADRYTKSGAYRGRVKANPFLQRSYTATIDMVRVDFGREYRIAFIKWAKATWPQITR